MAAGRAGPCLFGSGRAFGRVAAWLRVPLGGQSFVNGKGQARNKRIRGAQKSALYSVRGRLIVSIFPGPGLANTGLAPRVVLAVFLARALLFHSARFGYGSRPVAKLQSLSGPRFHGASRSFGRLLGLFEFDSFVRRPWPIESGHHPRSCDEVPFFPSPAQFYERLHVLF